MPGDAGHIYIAGDAGLIYIASFWEKMAACIVPGCILVKAQHSATIYKDHFAELSDATVYVEELEIIFWYGPPAWKMTFLLRSAIAAAL